MNFPAKFKTGTIRIILVPTVFFMFTVNGPHSRSAYAQITPPITAEIVGHLGGRLDASVTNEDVTYLAIGSSLVIVQNQNGELVRLGTLPLPDRIHRFHVSGDNLVLSYKGDTFKSIFDIIDVSDPTLPARVARSQISGTERMINKIVIDNNNAFLMPGTAMTDLKAVHVIDLSDPASPNEVFKYEENLLLDFLPSGNRAYVILGSEANPTINQIAILDITNNINYPVTGTLDLESAHRLSLLDNHVYITMLNNQGLSIVDVTDSQNPALIGLYGVGNESFTEMTVSNGTAVLRSSRRLVVLDVSNPATPLLAGDSELTSNFSLDGASGNTAFIRQDGEFKILDLADPANPITVRTYREPNDVRGQAIVSTHLYVATGDDIVVYSLENPEAPEIVQSLDFQFANKVFGSGTKLIVTDWNGPANACLYDISDPTLPQLLNTFTVNTQVLEVGFVGDYFIILKRPFNNVSSLKIMDMTDPANLQDVSEYILPGTATDMFIASDGSMVTVSYLDGATGHGFEIVDISNPASPARLSQMDRTEIPQTVLLQNDLLFVGLNVDEANGPAQFDVYDISDPANTFLQSSTQVNADSPVFQMIVMDGIIFASFPKSGIGSFVYDGTTTQFLNGPTEDYLDALLLTGYNPSTATTTGASLFKNMEEPDRYLYTNGGTAFESEIVGDKGIQIIKVGGGGQTGYTLTVKVVPAEAAAKGATVELVPDKTVYEAGELVQLTAKDGEEGWAFKEYSGDVSGAFRQQNILMTGPKKAKEVTAHYVQPTLTVNSEFGPRHVVCPCDADAEKTPIWKLTLKANEIDSWFVNAIKIQNLEDKKYIKTIHLSGGGETAQGTFNPDSTEMTFSFSPPISVPINSSVDVNLEYQFDLDTQSPECDLDRVYEYKTQLKKLSHVTAIPMSYTTGLLLGPTPTTSNSIFLARVENFSGYGFVSITEALNSELTSDGDELIVCPGVYKENLHVAKSVKIKSKEGKENTVIRHNIDQEPSNAIIYVYSSSVNIDGFTIENPRDKLPKRGIELGSNFRNLTFKNCIMDKAWIDLGGGVANTTIENVIFRGIENLCIGLQFATGVHIKNCILEDNISTGIYLQKSVDCIIEGCRIKTKKWGIHSEYESKNIQIIDNQIESGTKGITLIDGTQECRVVNNTLINTSQPIILTNANSNIIRENHFTNMNTIEPYIEITPFYLVREKDSRNNVIGYHHIDNDTMSYFQSFSQKPNRFVGNRLHKIALRGARHHQVDSNTVKEMKIQAGSENKIFWNTIVNAPHKNGLTINESHKNQIKWNTVEQNGKSGIYLHYSYENAIYGNDVINNEEDGIRLIWSNRNLIYHNRFHNNGCNGINLSYGFTAKADDNKITYNTVFNNEQSGITVIGVNVIVSHNTVYNNGDHGINGYDVKAFFVAQNHVYGHTATNHSTGIYLHWVHDHSKIINNKVADNNHGIYGKEEALIHDPTNVIKNNLLIDNKEDNTGIHLDGFSPQISGNWIENNNGAGIFTENGAQPVIHNNSIVDNNPFAISNTDGDVIIDAQQNWFGDAAGPVAGEISGQVNTDNWLTEPLSLLITITRDTVFMPLEQVDSVEIFFQNYADFDDVLDVSINSRRGWIQNETELTTQLVDSLGSSHFIVLESQAATGTTDTVVVEAFSQSNPQTTAKDSFIVTLYESQLATIYITPDSVAIASGDSLQFSATGKDQHGAFVSIAPVWAATGGTITENGMFTAGVDTGWYVITAQNGDGSVKGNADVYISGQTSVEDIKPMAMPTEFRLDQNIPNPFNPETSIGFAVKEPCRVILKVYDILGREVMTLADADYQAGFHNVILDANRLPTGVYFYRIQMQDFYAVKKMLLLE